MASETKVNAKSHWQAIRSVATHDENFLGIEATSKGKAITHGICRTTKLISSSVIKNVIHNFHSGQYLVLYESGNLEVFLKDGSPERLRPSEKFQGIVYASKPKLYVTWDQNCTMKVGNIEQW